MPDPEPSEKQPEMSVEDVEVGELEPPEEDKAAEGGGTSGGFRAGSLGPAHYTPPGVTRRRTWKPMVAAIALFLAAGWGISSVAIQLYVADAAEGEELMLRGIVIDYDDYYGSNYADITEIAGVEVSIDGMATKAVSDSNGKFEIDNVPGGRFVARLYKRDWDQSVNATFDTYLFRDYTGGDDRRPFPVKVRDLDPKATRPDAPFQPALEARLLDWTNADTVRLEVLLARYEGPIDDLRIDVREAGLTVHRAMDYDRVIDYTFTAPTGTGDYGHIYLSAINAAGETVVPEVDVTLPSHPTGAGGWRGVAFPDTAVFVHGATVSNSTSKVVLAHSEGATEVTWRVNGSAWRPWAPMSAGEAEVVVDLAEGLSTVRQHDRLLELMARNSTGNGTVVPVHVTLDLVPPALVASIPDNATAPFADLYIEAPDARAIRYSLPGGAWSPWQLARGRALVPLDDNRLSKGTFTVQAMDLAGNVAEARVTATLTELKGQKEDDYAKYTANLRVCVPLIVMGVIFSIVGGWACWRRRRPGLAMLGSLGAMLASGFTIWGAIFAVVALAAITLSRDEFEDSAAARAAKKEEAPEER